MMSVYDVRKFVYQIFSYIITDDDKNLLSNLNKSEEFQDSTDFDDNELLTFFSLSQRILVYVYSIIYIKIKYKDKENIEKEKIQFIQQKLGISNTASDYIIYALNEKRLAFIEKETTEKLLLEYLINTENTIVKFVIETVYISLQYERILNINNEKKELKGLDSSVYEHPEDRNLLEFLKSNITIEKLLNFIVEYRFERSKTILLTGNSILVTEKNMPYVYDALRTVCKILDVEKIPKLYIQQGFINASTMGAENPLISLHSGAISLLSYGELLFVLGHEVGHIKSKHLKYHMLATALPHISEQLANKTLGIAGLVGMGVSIPIFKWFRKSELTADRAGLLACQNLNDAISALMKISGYPPKFYHSLNIEHFREQYEIFEDLNEDGYNKIINLLSKAFVDHPWPVQRAHELEKWYKSGCYDAIINGNQNLNKHDNRMIDQLVKFCYNCGCKIDITAKYCHECGTKYSP
jgi:Zn-dependent protease with chaperone function